MNDYLARTGDNCVRVYILLLLIGTILATSEVSPASTQAIVKISADIGGDRSVGTGFFVTVDDAPVIITCYHVVEGCRTFIVRDANNVEIKTKIALIGPDHDLAVLKVEDGYRPPDTMEMCAARSAIQAGDSVTVLGHPYGIKNQQFTGQASQDGYLASNRIFGPQGQRIFAKSIDVIPLDVTIARGMSGGPVVWQGKVVGVISGSLSPGAVRTIAWAIPTTYLSGPFMQRFSGVWPKLSLMEEGWTRISLCVPGKSGVIAENKGYLYMRKFNVNNGNWKPVGPLPMSTLYTLEATYKAQGYTTYVAEIHGEGVNAHHTPPSIPRD